MPLPPSLRALRSGAFRRYYAGQAVSVLGTWIQSVALMWLAYRLSGSTVFTGLVGFLNSIPYLVLSPFAGVLGDRMDRRRILLVVLGLLTLQATLLAILSATGAITMPGLAALALFGGLCNAFETPTRQSFFVQVIEDRGDLPNAIALNSVLMNGARLAGPSLGGLLVAGFGETICFAINAASYLAVIAALVATRVVRDAPRRTGTRILADLAEGWRFAMGFAPVRRMMLLLGTLSLTLGPHSTLMPAIAVKTYGRGSELVGLFIGCVGLGAVVAAVSLARRPSVRGLARWIASAALLAGLGMTGFALSRSIPLAAAFITIAGFGMFLAAAGCNTILQSIVEDDRRGRVMSWYTLFFIGSLPLGHLAAGWTADLIGAPQALLAGGIACTLAGAAFASGLSSFREQLRPVYLQRGIIPAAEDPPR